MATKEEKQARWDKIHELRSLHMSDDEIAKELGLKNANSIRVWLSRNKDLFTETSSNLPSLDKVIKTLHEKKDELPSYEYLSNRLLNDEGELKGRDSNLIRMFYTFLLQEID